MLDGFPDPRIITHAEFYQRVEDEGRIAQLLREIAQRNERSMEILYNKMFSRKIYAYALHRCNDANEAEDFARGWSSKSDGLLARIFHTRSSRDAAKARLARRPKRFRAGLYDDILSGEEREANAARRACSKS